MTIQKLYQGGKPKAFTLSYDDGVCQDRRLVEIFNQNKLKATFNVNSAKQDEKNSNVKRDVLVVRMNASELKGLYKGHEGAVHSATHPHLENLAEDEIKAEITEDQKALEELFGYPVRGMAYPFGTYNDLVLKVLKEVGIVYSRTVIQTENFGLPEDFLQWHSTCHHNNPKLMELAQQFMTCIDELALFYVWGHSYEFDMDQNWELMEQFCSFMSGREDIWYATNIEIANYLLEINKLIIAYDTITNPTGIPLWVCVDGNAVEIKPGDTLKVNKLIGY